MLSAERSCALLLCFVWALATGCSSEPSAPLTSADGKVDGPQAAASVADAAVSSASQTATIPAPPGDAAAAVNAVLEGLNQNQPDALWDFLPASYQHDLTEVVHEFAAKTDAELWNKGFASLQQAVAVLKSQRQFILQSATLKQSVLASDQLATSWDPVVAFLGTIVRSDLSDADKLKSIDVRKFLSGTGRDVLSQFRAIASVSRIGTDPFQRWSDAQATLVSAEEQTATVRLEVPGEEPTEESFLKVEGKWIPQRMADDWPAVLEEAKTKLAQASPHNDPQRRQRALSLLAGFDGALEKLATATTQEEFDGALAPLVVMLLAVQASPPPVQAGTDGPAFPEPPASDNGVKVIVQGTITDAIEDSLITKLRNATDAPDKTDYESSRRDTLVIFDLRPVQDVEAFAKKIDFGTVRIVDKEHRAITVDLKPAQPR